jgi:hypothetical protein
MGKVMGAPRHKSRSDQLVLLKCLSPIDVAPWSLYLRGIFPVGEEAAIVHLFSCAHIICFFDTVWI